MTTPQNKPIPGENQVMNNAGGFVYEIDKFSHLRRFLILGSHGGTYYVTEGDLTRESAQMVLDCFAEDQKKAFALIQEVSDQGLAPKNDFCIFALALAFVVKDVDRELRNATFDKVVRTGTHLFQFVDTVNSLRGWGNALKKTVQRWYLSKDRDQLAYQLAKYRNREGWTHKDVMRMCHIHSKNDNNDIRAWAVHGVIPDQAPRIIKGYEALKEVTDPEVAARLIHDYRLTHEMVPTELQASPVVMEALLQHMPLGATIRSLAKLTKRGVLRMGNDACKLVLERMLDEETIQRSRIHPANYLLALIAYSKGGRQSSVRQFGYRQGTTIGQEFAPISAIIDALEEGFEKSFKFFEPTGARMILGVDVSGSMGWTETAGLRGVTPAEAAAVMALVSAKAERFTEIFGFCDRFTDLGITARTSFREAMERTQQRTFGRTDCAAPMRYALNNDIEADVFVVLTDNETWSGIEHPVQTLKKYRDKTGINAKLVVQAFAATKFSIADPKDPGMLDVVGMDSSTPKIINEFILGNLSG